MTTEWLKNVKAGDTVNRVIAGLFPAMHLLVEKVENGLIYCKGGWTFDQETGVEEDEELGWGKKFGMTGSYLVEKDEIRKDEIRNG